MLDADVAPDQHLRAALPGVLAPLGEVVALERLTGGLFATTFRAALADGSRVVIKTAPTATERLLTYEHDLLRTEALVYRLAAERPALLMPRLLLTDFTRAAVPSDVVVASHLDGVPLLELAVDGALPPDVEARVRPQLGALMARLHAVTGERFGYPDPATTLAGTTWPEAFDRIVGALLADARRWGTGLPESEIRAAVARHRTALADVRRPALVHTDLWAGNLFVDPGTLRLTGVIDPERAVWGDPLLELAGADQTGLGPVPDDLVAGYADAAGAVGPLALGTPAGDARLLLYRMSMTLVLLVEMTPRGYTGPGADAHRTTCEATLRAVLDGLAG
ncbi:phosphotransferase family protein [Cellulomonas sp. P4]|uniref:phosphotransferase family protein n=1 Tax=Cellulomonas sp. P4 TaxID=3142533 RepID=UPI0031BA1430